MPEPITPAASTLGRLANRLLTGAGPGSETGAPIGPPVHLDSDDPGAFPSLIREANHQRVTGVLAHSVANGLLEVDDEQFDLVARAHREAMAIALVLEQMLCRVHGVLFDAGIEHVVLKGPAVAHTVYPDPGVRDFGDIDLLFPAAQISDAVRVLEGEGARRQLSELAPGWDRNFAKSVTMTDSSGYELDLHRTIAPGVFGLRIDPSALFTGTQGFVVGGTELAALAPEGQILQACVHTAAGNRAVWLSSVCDIAQLTRSGRIEIDRFHDMVRRWDLAAVVERAVDIVARRLDGADVSVLMDGLTVRDRDRKRLLQYGRGFSGPALTGFVALPARKWPSYARALAWPSADNLADRGLTRRTHLRRLASYRPGH